MKKALYFIIGLLALVALYTTNPFNILDGSQQANSSQLNLPSFNDKKAIPATNQGIYTLQDLNNSIVNIANNSNKAVVTVLTSQTVKAGPSPLDLFFGNGRNQPREFTRQGLGSGVIISEEGYILTNNHVIQNADSIRVRLIDDQDYAVKVVGRDPQTDIAVLKLTDPQVNFDYISMGDSDALRIGEFVLAIGSPLDDDLAHTVTMGIVSAKGRPAGPAVVEDEMGRQVQVPSLAEYIQTDAAINPGNSGGALIDMNGRLVGINSAIATRTGGFQGIGFAIPINIARNVMESLIQNGRVIRGFLGIIPQEIDPNMAKALNLDKRGGVLVAEVSEDTPAEKYGLKSGDVIVRMDGTRVRSEANFRVMIASLLPGEKVRFDVIRDGKEREIEVTIGERENDLSEAVNQGNGSGNGNQNALPNLGFKVEEPSRALAERFELDNVDEGVVVTAVDRASNVARTLQPGDIIIRLGNTDIKNIEDFESAVRDALDRDREVLLVRYLRGQYALYGAIELPK